MKTVRLGVDFGTSNTVAVLELPNREPRPLLFDGSPLLPSAVAVDAGGNLVVGRDALHMATIDPGSFEPHPKRCIDDEAGCGNIIQTAWTSDGTWELRRNGRRNNGGRLTMSIEPDSYVCSGDTLTIGTSYYAETMTRIGN